MKNKLLLLSLVLSMITQLIYSQVPSYVPTNGLAGYWGFNGNANDQSGNSNNGTVNGASLTTDRFGNTNSAYNFDGISNFISIPNSSTLSSMTSITISAWININQWNIINNQGWFPILSKTNSSTYGKYRLGAFTEASTGYPSIYGNLETNATGFTQNNLYSINQWHQIVMTISNGNSTISLNGVEVFNGKTTYTGWNTIDNLPILIGKDIPGITDYAKGKIDDIGIWNRALTSQEITAMYNGVNYSDTCNAVSGSLVNGLVGYWPFCGNANDQSGNGLNGVVNGATLTEDRLGNSNGAYSFNGTDSQIIISDNSKLDLTNDFSISSWFYLNSFGKQWSNILSKHHQISGEGTYTFGVVSALIPTPQLAFQADPYFGTIANSGTNGQVSLNQWYNYTVSYQKSSSSLKYYLNGVLISTINIAFNIKDNSYNLNIGHEEGTADLTRWFNGKIDDIGIWNRALTQQEITQLYNQNQCITNISVTDTLIINVGQLSYSNPITYANNITIYPNPASTQVNISFNNITNLIGGNINIINSLGQQVATTPITLSGTNTTMSLDTWGGAGLYFVQILNAQGQILDIKKIILQ